MAPEAAAAPTSSSSSRPSGEEFAKRLCEVLLTEDFFQNYWEKKPYHLAASACERPAQLPELVTVDDVMQIVKLCGSSLKMFKRGVPSAIDNFMVAYLDGCSLIINQADRCNERLFTLCRTLGQLHFHHVFCVAYLTPANTQAVRLHNDDQDVFLLQVWGRKRWRVRNAPQLLAYTEEMLGKDHPVPPELIGEPVLEFTMEPQDVLYMPRGQLHEADTGDEPSLHVTITVPTSDYCWGVQLVKHLMGTLHGPKAAKSPLLGASLCGRGEQDAEALDAELGKLLTSWSQDVEPRGVLDAYEQRMGRTNVVQEKEFGHAMTAKLPPAVTEQSRVRLMYGVQCHCQDNEDNVVTFVRSDGQVMEMPVAETALPLMRALTSRPQAVLDLPCADPFERICVLQLLNQQGVVQLFLNSGGAPGP